MNKPTLDPELEQRLENIRLFADYLPAALIIHCLEDLSIVYMNKPGLERIGTTLEELQNMSQEQYYIRFFNEEDSNDYVPKIVQIVKSGTDDHVSYFQQVRVPLQKEWQMYVSNTKVFYRDENGRATHLITVAGMLDPVHHITSKVNRVMEEINFLRNNNNSFLKLTKREKEVLKYTALGKNSGEIAALLCISSTTADTHRRNIRSKLNLKNNYEAVKFAQAYSLI
ncbi:LuxR C-terminal-related transcriptional regulator [Pedobacter sp. AW31-3R]|uniref:LuxR C-terminal-related transcriptional regulator n=1 Tax=Pedobacter sp. AW31-3R TaxID=3445781 RepID=UPI003F9F271B